MQNNHRNYCLHHQILINQEILVSSGLSVQMLPIQHKMYKIDKETFDIAL